MSGFYTNLKKDVKDNSEFRKILFTTDTQQLVNMSLRPNQEIGLETHYDVTQFIYIIAGTGIAEIDEEYYALIKGSAVVIPPGIEHNIVNISKTEDLKLFTIYSPPEHDTNF